MMTCGRVWRAIIVLVAFFTLTPPSGAAPTPNDYMIVPGERIGLVSLQMSPSEMMRLLGPPSRVGKEGSITQYVWRNHKIRVSENADTGTIANIQTYLIPREENRYKTERGVGVGATRQQIGEAYGDDGCGLQNLSGGANLLSYSYLGIFFQVGTGDPSIPVEFADRVTMIGVGHKLRPDQGRPDRRSCSELRWPASAALRVISNTTQNV